MTDQQEVNQEEPDYLDKDFVARINETDNEALTSLMNVILQNYEIEFTFEKLEKINNLCKTVYGDDIDTENFIRQIKNLINKGLYSRITKRYKNELLELGIEPEKIEILSETQKNFFDSNMDKIEEKDKNDTLHLKDFEMSTKMPVLYTDYNIAHEDESMNQDIKKQKLYFNLKLQEDNEVNNCVLSIEKDRLIGMYEQIEKLQEKLDKLS